jgi:hypothetical protein
MTKESLDAQIKKDREAVSRLDESLKRAYSQELRSVVNQGRESRNFPNERVVLRF